MNTYSVKTLLLDLLTIAFLSACRAHAIGIDWVTVGDAGNAADTTGYGAVAEEYRIMKYEWTNSQYTAFLNAVDPDGSNPNGVYNASMESDPRGGISFNTGASAGIKYSAKANMGGKPVNFVNWWDTARVSNWLHNGAQTYGSTDSSATAPQNTGAYEVGTATSGNAVAKNSGALYWLPTVNQWYKAAYFTGSGAIYDAWGNGFNTAPASVTADSFGDGSAGGAGNFANFNNDADWNGQDGNVTTVGTNGGASFYGLYDMSGNIWEWNDLDGTPNGNRGVRGGGFNFSAFGMSKDYNSFHLTSDEQYDLGFRIVPEPSTCLMGVLGLAYGGYSMRRRRTCSSKVTFLRALMSLVFVMACVAPTPTPAVTYDMVTVGDAGNGNDSTGYGGVNYDYNIGKYEVTIGQYTEFLNAVAKSDPYGLYNGSMGGDSNVAGIVRTGLSGSYSYNVVGPSGTAPLGADSPSDRPVTYTSWFDAARFANWMANGQPTGAPNSTTTENGAYDLLASLSSGTAPAKNAINPNTSAVPTFYIPLENEWYKSAYYSPLLNSGSGGYYTYATQSNSPPGNAIGSGSNQANYNNGVFSVTQAGSLLTGQNYLTNVGAFASSASFYGTFDQNGNVGEWNDLAGAAGDTRGVRGGNWYQSLPNMSAVNRNSSEAGLNFDGFRLASPVAVPEPSTWVMGAVGIACAGWQGYRRRRAR